MPIQSRRGILKKITQLAHVTDERKIIDLVEREHDRTGGIFRLTPAWVGRPGIIIPGRRIKLLDDYISQDIAVNERWLCSVTFSDNGVYNRVCPNDHGLSYIVTGDSKILLKDALSICGDLLLGKGRKWDVLPKFFDNRHRIPNHMHPCDDHCAKGLTGKPESYYFPEELNMNRNAFPTTAMGVDESYTDAQILSYLKAYFKRDNCLTDLSNSINLTPGTGWFMPPCTLHAPGSLVTYELQVASDVSCIPESRVNDMIMPPDMIDRDLPVKINKDGFDKVCEYMLSMIRCKNSGNADNFRKEYFRPPVTIREDESCMQKYVVYSLGKTSQPDNPDLYSAKKTIIHSEASTELTETAAFGMIVLSGHGELCVPGKKAVKIELTSMYPTRDDLGGDEVFIAAGAAAKLQVACHSIEQLSFYQHFASNSNPAAMSLKQAALILYENVS